MSRGCHAKQSEFITPEEKMVSISGGQCCQSESIQLVVYDCELSIPKVRVILTPFRDLVAVFCHIINRT